MTNNGDVTDVLDSFFMDYAIDDDVDAESTRELLQQRSDMVKAVNDWHAKAEAFDAIMREWKDERMTKSHILETIQKYYDEYERSGSDAL